MIVVDEKINKGKPSIKASKGHATVKQICVFVKDLSVEEVMVELGVTLTDIELAKAYAKQYPQVLE